MSYFSQIAGAACRVAVLVVFCASTAPHAANAEHWQASGLFAERIIAGLTASQALQAMDSGVISSEQYVRILLRRIERHPELNAIVSIDPDAVIAAARAADVDRASGKVTKPLLGLPVLIKDSFNTEDLPTTVGTPALLGFAPDSNAAVVDSLLDAGAVILGKTNLHELQGGYLTNNPTLGSALNPYGKGLSPGGSSGGNAAALAARLAPLAVGADTAGSIRVPAALTGTVGFRPTTGRYSGSGIAPLSPTLDSAGPMARSVRDLALADAVITGGAIEFVPADLRGVRLGVPGAFFRDVTDKQVLVDFDRAIQRLKAAGANIVYVDIPGAGPDSIQAALLIALYESVPALAAYLQQSKTGVSILQLAGMVASLDVAALLGSVLVDPIPEPVYASLIAAVEGVFKPAFLNYMVVNELDAVLLPSSPVASLEQDAVTVNINDVDTPVFNAFFALGHYTPLVGAPTVTIPVGKKFVGTPAAGIDVAGLPGDDRRVLAIAAAIEDVVPPVRPSRRIYPVTFW